LGFIPGIVDISTLNPARDGLWQALAPAAQSALFKQCANGQQHQVCNWLVGADDPNSLCVACRLNDLIPDLTISKNRDLWHKLEIAKHRMIYTLLRLNLPTEGAPDKNRPALRFRFLNDSAQGSAVMTGHNDGIITINVAEADDSERERRKQALGEPFRTLLGHFRHEIAHYYWGELIANGPLLPQFRKLFGDDNQDYESALKNYYQRGAPFDWQKAYVSAYATAHPWEDWAETTAHYFHIVDTVETAASFGISLKPKHPDAKAMTANPKNIKDSDVSFSRILEHWMPLTYAMNELNRGMGLPDLYPFVLSPPVIEKLRFVHQVFHSKE